MAFGLSGSLLKIKNAFLKMDILLTLSLRRHLNNAPSCYTEHYKI